MTYCFPFFTLKFETSNFKLATKNVPYFFEFFCDVYSFCSSSECGDTAPVSSLVIREYLPVLWRLFWLMMKRNCHDLVVLLVFEIVI